METDCTFGGGPIR